MTSFLSDPTGEGEELEQDPQSGNYVIGLTYEVFDSSMELLMLRDLMRLAQDFPIAVNDFGKRLAPGLLEEAGIPVSEAKPTLLVVYKTGAEAPYYDDQDPSTKVIVIDLTKKPKRPTVRTSPEGGPVLPEQGRIGPDMTSVYLSRQAPRGNGTTDALVTLLWG